MKKYSFIIPYIDRLTQFRKTLQSFFIFYKYRFDFEIIVVKDSKTVDSEGIEELVKWFNVYWDIKLIDSDAEGYNPAPLYNLGVEHAVGEFVILTSPECLHHTNILKGLDEEFKKPMLYVVCACMKVDEKNKPVSWFQHSIHRNVGYHFCSALSKESFQFMGGFDEEFGAGYCFEDNDFKERVGKLLNFSLRDDLIVKHQPHDKIKVRYVIRKELWRKNKKIFEKKHFRYIEPSIPYKIEGDANA